MFKTADYQMSKQILHRSAGRYSILNVSIFFGLIGPEFFYFRPLQITFLLLSLWISVKINVCGLINIVNCNWMVLPVNFL